MGGAESLGELGLFVRRGFFDPDLCARLREEARRGRTRRATVVYRGETRLDENARRARCAELSPPLLAELETKLEALRPVLSRHFGVTLTGRQPSQLVIYREGDFFKPHTDDHHERPGPGGSKPRKVSLVIFLNDASRFPAEEAFCGGELVFYRLGEDTTWRNCRVRLSGEAGLAVGFPAGLFHEVAPVRHGERYTLVTWFT